MRTMMLAAFLIAMVHRHNNAERKVQGMITFIGPTRLVSDSFVKIQVNYGEPTFVR